MDSSSSFNILRKVSKSCEDQKHKKPKSEIRISSQYYLYTKLQGITCFYIPLNIGPNREKEVKKNKEMK